MVINLEPINFLDFSTLIKGKKRKKKNKRKKCKINFIQLNIKEWIKHEKIISIKNRNGYTDKNSELLYKYNITKSYKYIDELIAINKKLVFKIANKYNNNCYIEYNDLVQQGYIGLIKAIKNFDFSKKVVFSTYATYWVENEISKYYKLNQNGSMSISLHASRLKKKILNNSEDVSKIHNCTIANLKNMEKPIFLNSVYGDNDTEYGNTIVDNSSLGIFQKSNFKLDWEIITKDTISQKEKTILELRFLQDLKWSDIGKKFNLSNQAVSKIAKEAVGKIRKKYKYTSNNY